MRAVPVVLSLVLAAAAAAQQDPEAKLHPYLRQQLQQAKAGQLLPVYFVIGDRLGYDHFFPRLWRLPLAERRATAVRELRQHASRTQADLLDYLGAEVRAGNAKRVSANWLGNFVQAEATPLTILTAAAVAEVSEVWFDYSPPRAQVEDRDATAPLPAYGPPPPPPGSGATSVHADVVWNYGFRGQGVVVANVDGGMTSHTDLNSRLWTNALEIPGNNNDDDHNGLIDDVHGWAFDSNGANFDDGGGHGTNTSGAIAADGTCTGVVEGMAPAAQLMICRINPETSQWNGIQYAIAMGADLQTSSYSYKSYFNPPPNYKMHRDIGVASLAAGLIRTNSTSNDGSLCNSSTSGGRPPFNISAPGCLPSPYMDPNQTLRGGLGGVIGVAAWNFTTDALMSYSPCGPFAWYLPDLQANVPGYPSSNWDPLQHNDYPWTGGTQQGLIKPDVAAPTNTRTPSSGPCNYTTFSGTSNATPCANGVMALWKCANPSLTPEDVAMIVHQTSRDRGSIPGKENRWGAGVIDAEAGLYRALCVHRVDGQPQWSVEHSLAGAPLEIAVDGVPSSLGVILVGFSRQQVPFGPLTLGVGPFYATLLVGLTDANGDLSANVPLWPATIGLPLFTQAFVWDQTYTNRMLSSNVVGLTVTP